MFARIYDQSTFNIGIGIVFVGAFVALVVTYSLLKIAKNFANRKKSPSSAPIKANSGITKKLFSFNIMRSLVASALILFGISFLGQFTSINFLKIFATTYLAFISYAIAALIIVVPVLVIGKKIGAETFSKPNSKNKKHQRFVGGLTGIILLVAGYILAGVLIFVGLGLISCAKQPKCM